MIFDFKNINQPTVEGVMGAGDQIGTNMRMEYIPILEVGKFKARVIHPGGAELRRH